MSDEKPVVLLVDDSRVMRIALKKILQADYTIVEAANGELGWDALAGNGDIKCVFTDLSMPELDGFGLLKRIRQSSDQRLKRLPVIIITGNEDSAEMRKDVLSRGANDVILKPFQSGEILATTKKFLSVQAPAPAETPASTPRPAAEAPSPAKPTANAQQVLARLKSETEAAIVRAKKAEAALLQEREARGRAEAALKQSEAQHQQRPEVDVAQIQAQRDAALKRAETAEAAHKRSEEQLRQRPESDTSQVQAQLDAAHRRTQAAEEAKEALAQELDQVRKEFMLRQRSSERLREDEEGARLKRELDAALKRAATAERFQLDYEHELEQHKARIAELAGDNDKRLAEEVVARQRAETRVSQMQAELQAATEQVAEFEAGRDDRLQSEIATQQRLQAQLTQMEVELTSAAKRVAVAEAAQRHAEAAQQQAEAALKQAPAPSDSHKEESMELLRAEELARQQAEQQVERLRSELEEARERARAAEQEQRDAAKAKRDMDHELTRLRAEVDIMRTEDDDASQSTQEFMNLQSEVDAAVVRAEAAELAQRDVEDELAKMAAGLEEAEQAKRNAEHSVMRMTAQMNAMRKQLDKLPEKKEPAPAPQPKPKAKPGRPEKKRVEPRVAPRAEPEPALEGLSSYDEDEDNMQPIDFDQDELVDLMPRGSRGGSGAMDRFNSTMVAVWKREQRGQRILRLGLLAAVVIGGVIGAHFMGLLPGSGGDAPEAVETAQTHKAMEQAPPKKDATPLFAEKAPPERKAPPAERKPPPARPVEKPVESVAKAVEPPAPALIKPQPVAPDIGPEAFERARASREREVRGAAQKEFQRLLAAQRPAAPPPSPQVTPSEPQTTPQAGERGDGAEEAPRVDETPAEPAPP